MIRHACKLSRHDDVRHERWCPAQGVQALIDLDQGKNVVGGFYANQSRSRDSVEDPGVVEWPEEE